MSTRAIVRVPNINVSRATASWAAVPWLWCIIGLGALLRLVTLGRHSLWLDEGWTYWPAIGSPRELVSYLRQFDMHPPLHFLLVQPMIALGGDEWLLRLPSALAGIVSIWLLYTLGTEVFDHRTGLVAAFMLAVSPLHLWHSQEARMYALVAALTLAAALCAVRALRTHRWQDWAMLAMCQALALWTNSGAIWFTLALNAAALLQAGWLWREGRWWPWVGTQLVVFCLYLPWLPSFLLQIKTNGVRNGWIAPATAERVLRTLTDFVSYRATREWAWPDLALLLLVLAVGAVGLLREARGGSHHYVFLACWLLVPVGLSFLVSQPYVQLPGVALLVKPGNSIFLTRNLIIVTFPLYLLLARGLVLAGSRQAPAVGHVLESADHEVRRATHAAAGPAPGARRLARLRPALLPFVLIVLVAVNASAYWSGPVITGREDWRAAASTVAARATPDDVIVFAPTYLEVPFAYYYTRQSGAGTPRAYPRRDTALQRYGPPFDSPAGMIAGYQRIWLVTAPVQPSDPNDAVVASTIAAQGRLLGEWPVRGATVQLYEAVEATP